MRMKTFDVVVIGGGPAGYVAAIRCGQLGMSTALVDEYTGKNGKPSLGGTCLNAGCIPSKALLDSSEHYDRIKNKYAAHGITTGELALDVPKMIGRKDKIVESLTQGVAGLLKKNKVTWLQGHGRLELGMKVRVTNKDGDREEVQAKHIILATGSVPRSLPNITIDQERIVDSTGALDFQEVPRRLGVIGAGVIGLELGSVWSRLGAEVVVLEAMDDFLATTDSQIAGEALKEFKKQGLDIHLGARVKKAETKGDHVLINYEDADGSHVLEVDKLVVAVGRKPHTDGLNATEVDLLMDESGYIHVDEFCATNIPDIYAIGDVVRGPMLAHKGSEEGVMVAERLAGMKTRVNHATIPWVIYTWPEIAWVGKSESDLKQEARPYRVGTFPLRASGRALAMQETTGMVKMLADAETDEILGVHIFGAAASEMIAEAVVAMEYKASAEDLACIVHAHPTLSETVREAALAVHQRAIHI
jgi:dihydrolipoamide dehydrogenase